MALGTIKRDRTLQPLAFTTTGIKSRASGRGRLPELCVIVGLGLLSVAISYASSRFGQPGAEAWFWLGLITIVLPIAARIFGNGAARSERIALIVLAGLALTMVKILHGPLAVSFSDEFAASLNVELIDITGHLFARNPLLPATGYYPGLPTTIFAVSSISGLPVAVAGFVVIAAGRLAMMLGLFLFFERVSGSARTASIVALIYVTNPNFVFFDSQTAYESLALPFAAMTIFFVARRRSATGRLVLIWTVLALASAAMTIVTHHLTSLALTLFLLAWTAVAAARRSTRPQARLVAPIAAATLVAMLSWSLFVAQVVVDYLTPVLGGAIDDFYRLVTGAGAPRELFRYAGQLAPAWEQATVYAAVGLLLLGIPLGLRRLSRDYRRDPVAIVLALAALGYPASLALRLTALGAETANRASEFVFFGLGFVLAIAVADLSRRVPARPAVLAVLATVLFMGGLMIGWPRWARLPGPYLVAADTRSIERQGVEVARWTRELLGPDNRFVSDRTNRLLLTTYGRQRPVTGYGDRVDTKSLILSPRLDSAEERVARLGNVRYVLIDRRLSTSLPYGGVYVERGELSAIGFHRVPLGAERLDKFDDIPSISRVFDSGDIRIYDIEAWWSR